MVDLAAVMGVRPWETDDLTMADLTRLAAAIEAMHKELRERGVGRG